MGYKEDIAKINAALERMPGAYMRALSLEALRQVVQSTPVDTGRARSNWFMGIGAAVGTASDDTSGANIPEAEAKMALAGSPGEVHITNNLPYIEALNNGSSIQAPANFVENAVQAATIKANRMAKNGLKDL